MDLFFNVICGEGRLLSVIENLYFTVIDEKLPTVETFTGFKLLCHKYILKILIYWSKYIKVYCAFNLYTNNVTSSYLLVLIFGPMFIQFKIKILIYRNGEYSPLLKNHHQGPLFDSLHSLSMNHYFHRFFFYRRFVLILILCILYTSSHSFLAYICFSFPLNLEPSWAFHYPSFVVHALILSVESKLWIH